MLVWRRLAFDHHIVRISFAGAYTLVSFELRLEVSPSVVPDRFGSNFELKFKMYSASFATTTP
jgi:hypothetical protein